MFMTKKEGLLKILCNKKGIRTFLKKELLIKNRFVLEETDFIFI